MTTTHNRAEVLTDAEITELAKQFDGDGLPNHCSAVLSGTEIIDFARAILAQAAPKQQQDGWPDDLHPDTARLVENFAVAMAQKLAAAERKYGYSNGWQEKDWMDKCRADLLKHIAKGDPRDVANYCAFLWWHNEPTAAPVAAQPQSDTEAIAALRYTTPLLSEAAQPQDVPADLAYLLEYIPSGPVREEAKRKLAALAAQPVQDKPQEALGTSDGCKRHCHSECMWLGSGPCPHKKTQEPGQARELPPLNQVQDMLEVYAESYDTMSRLGDGKVHCHSVAVDIRQNMIPAAAQAAPAVPADVVLSVEFTRQDLGPTGTNYPHIRAMLGFIEGLIAAAPSAPAQEKKK